MFAFLFSKIGAYLVGAVLIVALAGGGYLYVKHLQHRAAAAELKAANLEVEKKVLTDQQKPLEKLEAKTTKVRRRVNNEQKTIDQEVGTVDDPGLQQLYDRYRVRPHGEIHPAAAQGKGRPQNAAAGGSP